jgi:hypothetical protein
LMFADLPRAEWFQDAKFTVIIISDDFPLASIALSLLGMFPQLPLLILPGVFFPVSVCTFGSNSAQRLGAYHQKSCPP